MAALLDMQKIVAIIQAKGKVLKIDFALHNSFHYFTSVFSLYTNFETVSTFVTPSSSITLISGLSQYLQVPQQTSSGE